MDSRLVVIKCVLQYSGVVSTENYSLDEFAVLLIMDVGALGECIGHSQYLVEHVQSGMELSGVEVLLLRFLALFNEFLKNKVVNLGLETLNNVCKLASLFIDLISSQIIIVVGFSANVEHILPLPISLFGLDFLTHSDGLFKTQTETFKPKCGHIEEVDKILASNAIIRLQQLIQTVLN